MLGATLGASAQNINNSDPDLPGISARLFKEAQQRAARVDEDLLKSSLQYLHRIEVSEQKIKKKLAKKDAALAAVLFNEAAGRYASFQKMLAGSEQLTSRLHTSYLARLDTLQTAFTFLSGEAQFKNLPQAQEEIRHVINNFGQLQQRFNQAEEVKRFVEERKVFLQQQLGRVGLAKELKGMQKQVYYYQSQLQEYKTLFNNPSRLETEAVYLLKKMPRFNQFFQSHSALAGMFRLPGSSSEAASLTGTHGLQSRDAVMQNLVQRMGSPAQVQQLLQQQLQGNALSAFGQLKDKALSTGSSGEEKLPEFLVNSQRTKRIKNRLELGGNLRTVKANRFFPSTTDIGFSIGYKFTGKSIIGIGGSYRMGWGADIRHMSITHQGVGTRTFVDYKMKGNFWLSGGAEMNYRSQFHNFDVLNDYSAWQKSALLGLSKKYRMSGKLNGNMQLLYDFLWKQQVPRTQPVVFRIGYSLR